MEYILENELLKLSVSPKGAELTSLVHKQDNVEHIWDGGPLWSRHAPILFPYTGLLRNKAFTVDGKTYSGGQHGFARDLEHTLVSQGADELVFCLRSNHATRQLWPFEFALYSTYRIDGQTLYHSLTVENTGERELSFGIGYHPAFRIPFDDRHTYEDYEFRFDKPQSPMCLKTEKGLVSDRIYSLGANLTAIALTDTLFDNDSHCMFNLTARTLGIYEKDSGRAVVCNIQQFPYTLIWSKPGKPQFVCIEPWHSVPDTTDSSGIWQEKPAAAVLAPGESFTTTMELTFTR